MPRRPRPASRRPPAHVAQQSNVAKLSHTVPQVKQVDEASTSNEDFFEFEGDDGSISPGDGSEDEDDASETEIPDVDDARVAQWVDDEELEDGETESESGSSASEGEPQRDVRTNYSLNFRRAIYSLFSTYCTGRRSCRWYVCLQRPPSALSTFSHTALASLPFGTLRKAQKELARASAVDAPDADSESEEDESEVERATSRYHEKGKGKEVEEPSKLRKEIPKRPHKHAYVPHTILFLLNFSPIGR